MLFISCCKLFSFLRYLHFSLFRKAAYQNAMVDLKIYDVTDLWENNYNTRISQFQEEKACCLFFLKLEYMCIVIIDNDNEIRLVNIS